MTLYCNKCGYSGESKIHSRPSDAKRCEYLAYRLEPAPPIVDKVVEAVRKDLLDRSNVGIKKYGTTLDGNSGDLRYWLNHAYEEALDHANYLKRAIMEIDNGNTKNS